MELKDKSRAVFVQNILVISRIRTNMKAAYKIWNALYRLIKVSWFIESTTSFAL